MSKVYVIGVGMTKFEKPGKRAWDYPDMAREAGTKALADAGVEFQRIEEAYVGYVYGESTSGQRAVYELGITGIPIVNVNNNCSTGSTALYLATRAIQAGHADCVLALGFEKMNKGSLGSVYDDREQPMAKHILALAELYAFAGPPAAWMFGAAGREHAALGVGHAHLHHRHRAARAGGLAHVVVARVLRAVGVRLGHAHSPLPLRTETRASLAKPAFRPASGRHIRLSGHAARVCQGGYNGGRGDAVSALSRRQTGPWAKAWRMS